MFAAIHTVITTTYYDYIHYDDIHYDDHPHITSYSYIISAFSFTPPFLHSPLQPCTGTAPTFTSSSAPMQTCFRGRRATTSHPCPLWGRSSCLAPLRASWPSAQSMFWVFILAFMLVFMLAFMLVYILLFIGFHVGFHWFPAL